MSFIPNVWRKWFGFTEDGDEVRDTPEGRYQALQEASGSKALYDEDNKYKKLELKKKLPPRCVKCKQFMGKNAGMHIMITTDWRLHTACFERVVDHYIERGETIDLTTGEITKLEEDVSP